MKQKKTETKTERKKYINFLMSGWLKDKQAYKMPLKNSFGIGKCRRNGRHVYATKPNI